jgi:hypothetical protein
MTGIAMDYVFAPRLAVILMATSAAGFAALAVGGAELLPYVALFVGLSLGAEIDLIVFLASRYFPVHHFGGTFGLLCSSFLVGVAVSPARGKLKEHSVRTRREARSCPRDAAAGRQASRERCAPRPAAICGRPKS